MDESTVSVIDLMGKCFSSALRLVELHHISALAQYAVISVCGSVCDGGDGTKPHVPRIQLFSDNHPS